jgi:hypothetical protein
MPEVGQILHWTKYRFPEGNINDKDFVVINDSSSSDELCLMLITTSQEKQYLGYKDGCNPRHFMFFIPKTWGECFPKPTFIKLPFLVAVPCIELWAKMEEGVIRAWKSRLSADCMTSLKECLKGFSDDIASQYYPLIFG